MSRKPGIANGWFQKYHSDVYPHDRVVIRGGKVCKPPRYYDKLYFNMTKTVDINFEYLNCDPAFPIDFKKVETSFAFDELKESRLAKINVDDNTPERLQVKQQVTLAKLSRLKRKLI